jgi:uncharacterized membrane protein
MNQDERLEWEIERYLGRLRRALGALQTAEIDEIVLEIRGHIAERLSGSAGPATTVGGVLEALGDPEELAAAYQTEAVLARGRASQSPLALLGAVQRWAMEGLLGLVIFLVGISGYSLAVALIAVAVLKPFFARHVGFWWNPPEYFVFGFVSEPASLGLDILGWWIVPIALLAGGLLWLGITRVLRALLRRYRGFASPLGAPDGRAGERGTAS